MKIGRLDVGRHVPPVVVAELSGNHDGSLDRALAIVDAAADAGAQAIKLQTYTADAMTLDLDRAPFIIEAPSSIWRGRRLHDLYSQAATPWEWHEPIFERARARGLVAFSSPFDADSVAFLDGLDVPALKIASIENHDLPLIRAAAATGRPLIISTGLATLAELAASVEAARAAGCHDLVLLRCTSSYPADPSESHLTTIPQLRTVFGCEVGLSDHTLGLGPAIASVALGASMIEKHVTLERSSGGVDAAFSLEPRELAQLCTEVAAAWSALGEPTYGPTSGEAASLELRRSLYVTEDLQAGALLDRSNVRAIRPAGGLPPSAIESVLGRVVTRPVPRGTPLTWELLRDAT